MEKSKIVIHPARHAQGELEVPGDKSISHRAVILGSLANGTSEFSHFLEAEDCLRTVEAFRAMGVSIEIRSDHTLRTSGVGPFGLKGPREELYLGNSGTSMRLFLGLLAGQSFSSTLTGDPSLSNRPMKRVVEPLRSMGAQIEGRENGNFAPLRITGRLLKAMTLEERLGSAQVKSAILLAGLYAEGETCVVECIPSRDHTERMLPVFGAPFRKVGNRCYVKKATALKPASFYIPGDVSSAAFFMVAAAIMERGEVAIRRVGLNPTRCGILEVLETMGADVQVQEQSPIPEPQGEVWIRHGRLRSVNISRDIPFLIDELPVLMVACALARGRSTIRNIAELRVKETDRIHSMCENLKLLGVQVKEQPDAVEIEGVNRFRGGVTLSSFGDHRTAMSCAVAALCADHPVTIEDVDCVKTSFPEFFDELRKITEG